VVVVAAAASKPTGSLPTLLVTAGGVCSDDAAAGLCAFGERAGPYLFVRSGTGGIQLRRKTIAPTCAPAAPPGTAV